MAKSKEDKAKLFDEIILEIGIEGKSLRDALKGRMSSAMFFELIKDENNQKRYARATEERADLLAEEILSIADNGSNADNVIVQRDRLRIDSRKWLLSKLQPKKYGDKLDVGVTGNITLQFDPDDKSL